VVGSRKGKYRNRRAGSFRALQWPSGSSIVAPLEVYIYLNFGGRYTAD